MTNVTSPPISLCAIADRILDQEFTELVPPGPDERWQDWLTGLAERLRRALLAHPDGARILSASQLCLAAALGNFAP
jgi:TetR/AcrR family transcriptional regulator, tetracycline repressor protein